MADSAPNKTDDAPAAHGDGSEHGEHEDHSLPMWMLGGTLAALLILTFITVVAAYIDLGDLNTPIAMFIATVKASLVALIFMHLRWDKPFNAVILLTSLGMLALFLTIASLDTSEYQKRMDPTYGQRWMASEREKLKKELKVETLYPRHGEGEGEGGKPGANQEELQKLSQWAARSLGALPKVDAKKGLEDPKARLGQLLYHDPRMSQSKSVSCSTCHPLDEFGVDGKPTSAGHAGTVLPRNTPTVYNAYLQDAGEFWDARAADVEEQAKEPLKDASGHALSPEQVVKAIKAVAGYRPLFKAAFPGANDPVTMDNIAKALAAFERLLVARGRFDAFVEGKLDALKPAEIRGLEVFKGSQCITCHSGSTVGGNMKQKLGLIKPYPTKDKGLAEHTKQRSDEYIFKVSQLRDVAKTGPYLHDGSIATLEGAVKVMAEYQLPGITITDEQMKDLVAFLGALTGELDPALKAKPELPK